MDKEKLKGKMIQTASTAIVYGPNSKEAIKLYGEAAKNGAVIFTDAVIADKLPVSKTDSVPESNKIFTKVEVSPSFPGGDVAWAGYIKKIIEGNIDELSKENKSRTCRVRFIVDIYGTVSEVQVLSMQGTKLAQVSLDAIKKGPKWIPAMQNDHIVTDYKEQPITFTIQDN